MSEVHVEPSRRAKDRVLGRLEDHIIASEHSDPLVSSDEYRLFETPGLKGLKIGAEAVEKYTLSQQPIAAIGESVTALKFRGLGVESFDEAYGKLLGITHNVEGLLAQAEADKRIPPVFATITESALTPHFKHMGFTAVDQHKRRVEGDDPHAQILMVGKHDEVKQAIDEFKRSEVYAKLQAGARTYTNGGTP